MCGIAGIYGQGVSIEDLVAMVASMRHRGPDDSGTWQDKSAKVALGNRRLAVQDLSPAGHMPMTDGRCWLTYNGEIYNYRALREELAATGHRFQSTSDTEVILKSYQTWGIDCLQRFRGMFAFALFDPSEGGRLFLARDHFGIKPLYWAEHHGTIYFGSEIRTILAAGRIERIVDRQAVWDYLSAGSVIPPRTIVTGVNVLLPGHAMVIERGDPASQRIWRWWDLIQAASSVDIPQDYPEAVVELRHLLNESVHLQRVADVPVGAFLSGGIDSSTIVGLMTASTERPLETVSAAFRTTPGYPDELAHARQAAKRFGTQHEEVTIKEDQILDQIDTLINALDQPSVDGFNTYFVSEAARQRVTVALSGLGADELFAGYPHFGRFQQIHQRFQNGHHTLAVVTSRFGKWLPGRWRLPLAFAAGTPAERYASVRRFYSETDKWHLIQQDWLNGTVVQPLEAVYADLIPPDQNPIAQVSYVEVRGYMAHTLLRDVDAMSMAHSLEVRVPYLDPVLAAFAFALPDEWKWRDGIGKAILRDAVRDLVPAPLLKRRKMGFDLPVTHWLDGTLRALFASTLASATSRNLLLPAARRTLVETRRPTQLFQAWSIFILLRWMELQGMVL